MASNDVRILKILVRRSWKSDVTSTVWLFLKVVCCCRIFHDFHVWTAMFLVAPGVKVGREIHFGHILVIWIPPPNKETPLEKEESPKDSAGGYNKPPYLFLRLNMVKSHHLFTYNQRRLLIAWYHLCQVGHGRAQLGGDGIWPQRFGPKGPRRGLGESQQNEPFSGWWTRFRFFFGVSFTQTVITWSPFDDHSDQQYLNEFRWRTAPEALNISCKLFTLKIQPYPHIIDFDFWPWLGLATIYVPSGLGKANIVSYKWIG